MDLRVGSYGAEARGEMEQISLSPAYAWMLRRGKQSGYYNDHNNVLRKLMRQYPTICVLAVCVLFLSGCTGIYPPVNVRPVERAMLVTGYCKCGKCCNWRRTWYGRPVYASGPNKGKAKAIGITASSAAAGHGTIAADLTKYPFGTIMYVDGYGYGRVEDTGSDIKGDHIDLYFPSHSAAMKWGEKNMSVKIWMMGKKAEDPATLR